MERTERIRDMRRYEDLHRYVADMLLIAPECERERLRDLEAHILEQRERVGGRPWGGE